MKIILFFFKAIFRMLIVFFICIALSIFLLYKYSDGNLKKTLDMFFEKFKQQAELVTPTNISAEIKRVRNEFKRNKFKLK